MIQQSPPTKSHRILSPANVIKVEAHKKWLIFLCLTCSLLWFSGYLQREIQLFQGRSAAAPGDFQAYYIAGLVARQKDDNRLYSYREINDPNDSEKKIIVNPQLDIADPDSTFARLAKSAFPPQPGKPSDTTQYLYPPFFSTLLSPLTRLPFQIAAQVWYVLTFLFLGLAIFLTVRTIYENSLNAFLATGFIMLLAEFTFPMQDLLWAGNVGAVILFFYAAGIFFQSRNCPGLSALFIALAVFIKLTPIIIIPLMIMRRQWKWLAAFIGWSILLFTISLWQLGWQNHQEFLTKIMPVMSNGIAERNNRSLLSIYQFVGLQKVPTIEDIKNSAAVLPTNSNVPFKIFAGLILLGILYYSWRINRTSSGLITEIYSLILLSLIISPVSWRHGYVLAVLPLIFIWLHPLTQKWSVVELSLLTAATVFIFSILPDYALSVNNAFLFQMLMVSVMPTGVLISIFLLLKIQRDSVNALHDNTVLQNQSEEVVAGN